MGRSNIESELAAAFSHRLHPNRTLQKLLRRDITLFEKNLSPKRNFLGNFFRHYTKVSVVIDIERKTKRHSKV